MIVTRWEKKRKKAANEGTRDSRGRHVVANDWLINEFSHTLSLACFVWLVEDEVGVGVGVGNEDEFRWDPSDTWGNNKETNSNDISLLSAAYERTTFILKLILTILILMTVIIEAWSSFERFLPRRGKKRKLKLKMKMKRKRKEALGRSFSPVYVWVITKSDLHHFLLTRRRLHPASRVKSFTSNSCLVSPLTRALNEL